MNSDYESAINELIPLAVAEADKKVRERVILGLGKNRFTRGVDGKGFYWNYHSEFYHAAMNRLAKERGLR